MKKKYIIIALYDYMKVMQSVEMYLEKGWECQGGISITHMGQSQIMYAQAMIKTTQE